MAKKIFSFLSKQKITSPNHVDRIIVTAFVKYNKLQINYNKLLLSYIDLVEDKEIVEGLIEALQKESLNFDYETLVRLFEFVVSPSDKVVNGAVYTPQLIREYIVANCFEQYQGNHISDVRTVDIACGCGGFLLTLAETLHKVTRKTYADIFNENIFGIDIADYSIQRSKILLSLLAVLNGEDIPEFSFNLFTGNSLDFDWAYVVPEIRTNMGFDIIVGNPPYVCSRNMLADTLQLLEKWEVSKSGHPDLYIPFFQIGFTSLSPSGILGYITVNTFIKSVNGRALREYFARCNADMTIISFGGEQLFSDRNTYTCICFLSKNEPGIKYIQTESKVLANVIINQLNRFEYKDLHHHDGWNLVNDDKTAAFIKQVESIGKPFKDLYNTKNGIATLKNEVYKFKPCREDRHFYYLHDGDWEYPIEKAICRDIVNANKLRSENDLISLREKIIFPYDNQIKIISEDIMESQYPGALQYLFDKKDILAERDKGEGEYEAWYAYGRRQSMDIRAHKLFFPHICEKPIFTICEEEDLLFYNGMAIVSENLEELKLIKKILESRLFYTYMKNTTKNYASGYISMSRNYLKNFGVYQFDDKQKRTFLDMQDSDTYLESIYDVRF